MHFTATVHSLILSSNLLQFIQICISENTRAFSLIFGDDLVDWNSGVSVRTSTKVFPISM